MIEFGELRGLPVFEGVSDASLNRAAAHAADVRVDEGSGWCAKARLARSTSCCPAPRPVEAVSRRAAPARGARRPGRLPRRAADRPRHDRSSPARAPTTPLRVARFDKQEFGDLVRESEALRDRIVEARSSAASRGSRRRRPSALALPVVIGRPHDPYCHGMRDFLSRNQVRFEWADPDEEWVGRRDRSADGLAAAATARSCCCPTDACCPARAGRSSPRRSGCQVGAAARRVRPRGGRRRADRSRGRGVRRLGGPAHAARRARGDRRPGGHLEPDRELPRVPERRLGRRPRRPRRASRPSGWVPRSSSRAASVRSRRDAVPHRRRSTDGTELGARAVILATGVAVPRAAGGGHRRSSLGIGVYYGAARTEAAGDARAAT